MNYDKEYREWTEWPECVLAVPSIGQEAEVVNFYREGKSYKGISQFKSIKRLMAKQVNQDFLDEICLLSNLEYLEMEVVTADSVSSLRELPKLRYLKIDGLRKAKDFVTLKDISSLRKLFLSSVKHLENIEFLCGANKLVAIGVEGGMYKKQKVATLKPLSGLKSLEALFLTSVQLEDKNLNYLATIPSLKYLGSARFAPKPSFDSLRQLMPRLVCKWCDTYEV